MAISSGQIENKSFTDEKNGFTNFNSHNFGNIL